MSYHPAKLELSSPALQPSEVTISLGMLSIPFSFGHSNVLARPALIVFTLPQQVASTRIYAKFRMTGTWEPGKFPASYPEMCSEREKCCHPTFERDILPTIGGIVKTITLTESWGFWLTYILRFSRCNVWLVYGCLKSSTEYRLNTVNECIVLNSHNVNGRMGLVHCRLHDLTVSSGFSCPSRITPWRLSAVMTSNSLQLRYISHCVFLVVKRIYRMFVRFVTFERILLWHGEYS